MIELPHAVVGATIAAKIGNPMLSLPLALLSHFIIDMIPHWNSHIYTQITSEGEVSKHSKKIVFLDTGASLIAGCLIAFSFYPDVKKIIIILLGSFLAVLPDVIEAPFFFFKSKNKTLLTLIKLQRKIQCHVSIIPGIITQIILLAVCYWILTT